MKAVQHRGSRVKTAIAAKEQHQFFWPLMLKADSDYPENEELIDHRSLQSDYWLRAYYSLFVSITGFLILRVWLDIVSPLPIGAEVTVEPEGAPPPSATVHIGSTTTGPNVMYTLRRTGVHDSGLVDAIPLEPEGVDPRDRGQGKADC